MAFCSHEGGRVAMYVAYSLLSPCLQGSTSATAGQQQPGGECSTEATTCDTAVSPPSMSNVPG